MNADDSQNTYELAESAHRRAAVHKAHPLARKLGVPSEALSLYTTPGSLCEA